MSYRGGDLDLRTPQSRSGSERSGFEPSPSGSREFEDPYSGSGDGRGPIWVDETLMACCNHAYDVALAHRSADVRIEHLLYALTRIDDAAEVLEKHGVRDASLRREVGSYIASELPIAPTNGQSAPRRSQAFEQALKLAAKQAYQRNRPAGVSDLLGVFIEVQPDLPGLQFLHRNLSRLSGDQAGKQPLYPPLAEGGYLGADPARRSMRPVYYDDYVMAEGHNYRHGYIHNHTDMVHNSRLAALEQTVMAMREDTGRFADEFAGRFVSLEQSLAGGRGDDGHSLRQTSERLGGIERSLSAKLEELARQASAVMERLEMLESRLQSADTIGGIDLLPVNRRLDKLENLLLGGAVAGELDERLRQLETLIAEKAGSSLDLFPIEGRLNDIETAILSTADSRQPGEVVTARIDTLEQAVVSRLSELQQAQASGRDLVLKETSTVGADVKAVSNVVQELNGGRQDLARRLEDLQTTMMRHVQEAAEGRETSLRELGEVHEAIIKLNANQHTLAGAIDQWRSESVSDMNTISARLTQLDIDNDAPLERLELISERMDGMYRATVERYHRRNRFWYWLFGTDDWIGASWPSQAAKVEQELRTVSAAPPSA